MNLELLSKEAKSFKHGDPASLEQITNAQKELNVTFPMAYVELLRKYGYISFYGTEINGLNCPAFLNVVESTMEARELYGEILNNYFVLEDLHIDGMLMISDAGGIVYSFYDGDIRNEFDSIPDYLTTCLTRAENE